MSVEFRNIWKNQLIHLSLSSVVLHYLLKSIIVSKGSQIDLPGQIFNSSVRPIIFL